MESLVKIHFTFNPGTWLAAASSLLPNVPYIEGNVMHVKWRKDGNTSIKFSAPASVILVKERLSSFKQLNDPIAVYSCWSLIFVK